MHWFPRAPAAVALPAGRVMQRPAVEIGNQKGGSHAVDHCCHIDRFVAAGAGEQLYARWFYPHPADHRTRCDCAWGYPGTKTRLADSGHSSRMDTQSRRRLATGSKRSTVCSRIPRPAPCGRLTPAEGRDYQSRLDSIRSDYLRMTEGGRYATNEERTDISRRLDSLETDLNRYR